MFSQYSPPKVQSHPTLLILVLIKVFDELSFQMPEFHSRWWLWSCLYFYLLSDVSATVFEYSQVNGRTRLTGSSFGVLGINATFDYVVRWGEFRCIFNSLVPSPMKLINTNNDSDA